MTEIILNLHIHTKYSDGSGSHAEVAEAALKSGIVDVVLITDHNVYVQEVEKYYEKDDRRVLLLVGEEIHDQARDPQKNHLLVFNTNRELATFAHDPQRLIDQVNMAGGLSFLAHPTDAALPLFHETDITWETWDVRKYTGIELWNAMSEFKTVVKSWLDAIKHAYFPELIAHNPDPALIEHWDKLLSEGTKIVAIGGSDEHQLHYHFGPFTKIIFPYEFHFHCINTHLLTPQPLTGDMLTDKKMIYEALKKGHCFIGYDLPAPTTGFHFTAQGRECDAYMGDEIISPESITLQIHTPAPANIRLLCNGEVVETWEQREVCTYITKTPGAYRVEATTYFLNKQRGWRYSNPIYYKNK
jgi:hypothetical protein